jgi:polar amino acid transport system substrate-binding protein
MKPMKKLLSALLALTLMMTMPLALAAGEDRLQSVKSTGKLVMATSPDYAPYEFLDLEGKPVGADISLANFIAEKLGVKLVIEAMDFDTTLAAVATGKVDLAISGISPTDERKLTMDFTRGYNSEGDQSLLILSKDAETMKALADFEGKLVAAQNGSLQQTLVQEQLPLAKLEPIIKIPDAIMMLLTGKVDAVAIASKVAAQYIVNYPELVLSQAKFDYTNEGEAVAVPLGSPQLLAAVDEIVAEVVASGQYLVWLDEALVMMNTINK